MSKLCPNCEESLSITCVKYIAWGLGDKAEDRNYLVCRNCGKLEQDNYDLFGEISFWDPITERNLYCIEPGHPNEPNPGLLDSNQHLYLKLKKYADVRKADFLGQVYQEDSRINYPKNHVFYREAKFCFIEGEPLLTVFRPKAFCSMSINNDTV